MHPVNVQATNATPTSFTAASQADLGDLLKKSMSSSHLRNRRCCQSSLRAFFLGAGPPLDKVKDCRDQKDSQRCGGQHPANHGGPHDLASNGTGSCRGPERDTSENEGKGGH